jgi:hypothetical protein
MDLWPNILKKVRKRRCDVLREGTYIRGGKKFAVLKISREYPLVLCIKVG